MLTLQVESDCENTALFPDSDTICAFFFYQTLRLRKQSMGWKETYAMTHSMSTELEM